MKGKKCIVMKHGHRDSENHLKITWDDVKYLVGYLMHR